MISKKTKNKKKKRSSPNFRAIFLPISQLQTFEGGLFSYGGGYFPFFTENRPQKHKKHAFLHTSQANGGARAPPAPPLATLLLISITQKSENRYTNQDLRLLAITFNCMPKNTNIQTHWADVPLAVEKARSNVIAKREISITEKKFFNCQISQIVRV